MTQPATRTATSAHVVLVMADTDPRERRAHTLCRKCGERLVIELPVRLEVWVAANRAFVEAHIPCAFRKRSRRAHDQVQGNE